MYVYATTVFNINMHINTYIVLCIHLLNDNTSIKYKASACKGTCSYIIIQLLVHMYKQFYKISHI